MFCFLEDDFILFNVATKAYNQQKKIKGIKTIIFNVVTYGKVIRSSPPSLRGAFW